MEATDTTTAQNSSTETKRRILKYSKRFLFGTTSVISAFVLLNWMWVMSGSNEWELEIDKDGVKVYSLKLPGYSNVIFKGVVSQSWSYGEILSFYIDGESYSEDCSDFTPVCVEYRFIKPWNPELMTNTQYWRVDFPFPFVDREMVVNGKVSQDEETKELLIENSAAPSLLPLNHCCVRLMHLHNTWRYTPQEDGRLRVVYIQNYDMGGFFPDFLTSFAATGVYTLLHDLVPKLMDNEKYLNAKLDLVEEY